ITGGSGCSAPVADGQCTVTSTTAGAITLNASYSGDTQFNSSSGTAPHQVDKTTPAITWNNPADISYGTALGGTQLNATASVAGTFVYTPAAGTVLSAGNSQTLHVDFTPSDTTNYNSASKDVVINVLKATPSITWSNPADIDYGTALGGT